MLTRLADDEMQVTTSSTYCEHHTFEHQLFNEKISEKKTNNLNNLKPLAVAEMFVEIYLKNIVVKFPSKRIKKLIFSIPECTVPEQKENNDAVLFYLNKVKRKKSFLLFSSTSNIYM